MEKKINLIGISGYIGSGKDTVARFIQALITQDKDPDFFIVPISNKPDENGKMPMTTGIVDYLKHYNSVGHFNTIEDRSVWEIKKLAYKLKKMVSLLTGIPTTDLEKEEVKKSILPNEWDTLFYNKKHTGEIVLVPHNAYTDIEGFKRRYAHLGADVIYSRHTTVRELLQKLGTEAVRDQVHPNAWVNALFADYKPIENEGRKLIHSHEGGVDFLYPNWIITDCRFPNEAQAIKDRGGIIIRVHRTYSKDSDFSHIKSGNTLHPSETSLDNWEFDYHIANDTTLENLLNEVHNMLVEYNIIEE